MNIAKPFLPPIEEFYTYLNDIWSRAVLSNNGPLVRELETKLNKYFDMDNLLYVTNGTIGLQMALKALSISGEVITTPFSYVATTSSIVWENCKPVFVDIDPKTLNINEELIEEAITEKTSALLVTHIFGNPCNIEQIECIAEKHNLKVIFDAAHCFSTTYKGQSILKYGDVSCISFHATKLFHTIEGGAVIANTEEIRDKLFRMRNFGHAGFYKYDGVGINGKNSEIHAAMGLCNLKYLNEILDKYRYLYDVYKSNLDSKLVGSQFINKDCGYNHSYYPVIFNSEKACLSVLSTLEKRGIHPRRYFYPALNKLEYVKMKNQPVAEDISKRILCLPMYYDLEGKQARSVCNYINRELGKI